MQTSSLKRNISNVYLSLLPFLTFGIALSLGHANYKTILPIGLLVVSFALLAVWILGAHAIVSSDKEKKHLVITSLMLIAPWILLCSLSGIGAPPFDKPVEYVATATEQQFRYTFLIFGGLAVAFGFALLKEKLKKSAENFYSWIGFIAIMIAAPLFVMNMSYYDQFLLETYKVRAASGSDKFPEWFSPVQRQFFVVMVVEVALTFLSTAAFAASLKVAGWFSRTACNIYILISLLCFIDALLSFVFPMVGFVVIPALPFIMPYYIGINLMKRTGNEVAALLHPQTALAV